MANYQTFETFAEALGAVVDPETISPDLWGEYLSYGAGLNSTALAVLAIGAGWRGPIVFADTGAEWPETYCYIEYFSRRVLKPNGLELIRLEAGSEFHSTKAQTDLESFCLDRGLIPLLAVRWCTSEFKGGPLDRWAKAQGLERGMIGFTIDEDHRRRDPKRVYPLDDLGINRAECGRIIDRAGLARPPKSGCFFCPGQALADWRRLFYDHAELYARAEALEENAASRNQKHATLDPHGFTLAEHRRRRWQGQTGFDLSEWLPCVCGL